MFVSQCSITTVLLYDIDNVLVGRGDSGGQGSECCNRECGLHSFGLCGFLELWREGKCNKTVILTMLLEYRRDADVGR